MIDSCSAVCAIVVALEADEEEEAADEEVDTRLLLSGLAGVCVGEEGLLAGALVFVTVFCFNAGDSTSGKGSQNCT